MGEWKEYKLHEIATIVDCEHKTAPLVDSSEYISVRTSNIKNGRIDFDNANRVSYDTFLKWTNRMVPEEGDIVLAREAPVGEVGYMPKNKKACLGQRTVLIKPNNDLIDSKYLLYYLTNAETKHELISRSTGSVVEHLNVKDIRDFPLTIEDNLHEQKSIASILSSLDDKIDLLHRQNKTLETLAETLFRQWFVEEVEEGWKTTRIGDVAIINRASIDRNFPYDEIEYLDTGSITDGIVAEYQRLNLKEAPSRARRIVQNNDVIISMVRPIQRHYGILKKTKPNMVVSTGFCVVTATQIDPHFIYLLLTQDDMTYYLESIAEGSTTTYPSLTYKDVENIGFLLPPKRLLTAFSEIASVTWEKIETNREQILALTSLRDTLLPKLMSGEVKVDPNVYASASNA